jgi:hypothetical protein
VDAWAVYHTINGFYRITSVPWICLAYVLALWVVEIGLAVVAINLLRFHFLRDRTIYGESDEVFSKNADAIPKARSAGVSNCEVLPERDWVQSIAPSFQI